MGSGGVQNVTNLQSAQRAHYVGEPFALGVSVGADWFVQYNGGAIQNLGFHGAGLAASLRKRLAYSF